MTFIYLRDNQGTFRAEREQRDREGTLAFGSFARDTPQRTLYIPWTSVLYIDYPED